MSVIIKGMKMPNYCGDCGVYESCRNHWADIEMVPNSTHKRPEYCPLIEAYDELATDLIPLIVDNDVIENCFVCGSCGHRVVWPTHQKKHLKFCWNCGIKFKEALHD